MVGLICDKFVLNLEWKREGVTGGESGSTDEDSDMAYQESETVKQKWRGVDEARGMIQEVGSTDRVLNIERSS